MIPVFGTNPGHRQLVGSVSGMQAIGIGMRFITNPCCRFRPRPGTFGSWRLCAPQQ